MTGSTVNGVTLDYRLGSDGSLTLRKGEKDGAFKLKVRLKVSGTSPTLGPVVRTHEVDIHFPGDDLVIGGLYDLDVARCRGLLNPIAGLLPKEELHLPLDPGPLHERPGNVVDWGGAPADRLVGVGLIAIIVAILVGIVGVALIAIDSQRLQILGAALLAASVAALLIEGIRVGRERRG